MTDNKQLMINAIKKIQELENQLEQARQVSTEPIAVIGMACRLPGDIKSPNEFWDMLCREEDVVSEIPGDRWKKEEFYNPEPETKGKMYTVGGGFLKDIRSFDAQFFGISPREAKELDPQQRILLEVVYEALENAGLSVEKLKGSNTGVFTGISTSDYSHLGFGKGDDIISSYTVTGNSHSMASGRISFLFGFHGPSFSVDTACSSSMVALHQACLSLRNRECEMAVAGGVNVMITPKIFASYSQSRILSPDGRCKTFDSSANGFVRSEGCGVIALKRFSDAKMGGDTILAVIRGTAINHDGRSSGLTVPNGRSQAMVIRKALENSGVSPGKVSYIEAHGTGTALGDPIEVFALQDVFSESHSSENPLYLGSVKTNIGHLEAAAGIVGVIKVVLALQYKAIPANLHFKKGNEQIPWDSLPFVVLEKYMHWKAEGKRIAGVSSFGLSGTNVHIVMEEAPDAENLMEGRERENHLFTMSAKNEEALHKLAEAYIKLLSGADCKLESICFTANTGRSHFNHRIAVVCRNIDQLSNELDGFLRGKLSENLVYGVVQTNYPSKKLSLDMKKQNWENTLHIMADLYVKGEVVDFDKLYEGRHCIKVLLPNYPFQRKEYWLEDTEAKTTEFSDVGTGLGKENTREGMINYLTGLIRNALSFGDETVDIHQPLLELGIDSITALQLNNTVKKEVGAVIPMSLYMEGISIHQLVEVIEAQLNLQESGQPGEYTGYVEGEL